jgi:Co/Zn/Cd efflux system component
LLVVLSLFFSLPGLIITSVFGFAILYKVEKDRKAALANSRVKNMAVDVVASHKIMYSMILSPILTALIVIAVVIAMAWYGYSFLDSLYGGFITIFAFPCYFYFCVLFADTAIRHIKQLYVNFLAVFQPRRISAI